MLSLPPHHLLILYSLQSIKVVKRFIVNLTKIIIELTKGADGGWELQDRVDYKDNRIY